MSEEFDGVYVLGFMEGNRQCGLVQKDPRSYLPPSGGEPIPYIVPPLPRSSSSRPEFINGVSCISYVILGFPGVLLGRVSFPVNEEVGLLSDFFLLENFCDFVLRLSIDEVRF